MSTRRQFLNRSLSTATLALPTAQHLCANSTLATGNDSKSLVCLFFNGGMDSYNLLIPRDSARRAIYNQVRNGIQVDNPLALNTDPVSDEEFSVHPSVQGMAAMFNGTGDFSDGPRLSFLANVGTLIKPLTQAEFLSPGPDTKIPRSLASHFDQYRQWQTSRPGASAANNVLTGWAGRLTDLFAQNNPGNEILNVSFSGNSLLQRSLSGSPFAIGRRGLANTGLSGPAEFDYSQPGIGMPNNVQFLRGNVHRRVLENDHSHYFESTYRQISRQSIEEQQALKQSIDFFSESNEQLQDMPSTKLGEQLSDVIKIIYARHHQPSTQPRRQTFFIDETGWDMHANLKDLSGKLREVSEAVTAFQRNLCLLNLEDDVIGFSASDFARTLRSNGRGSDHAWGGPQFIFGKPIVGGRIFGPFADQAPNSLDDIGAGGRMIPYHSTDEYYSELIKWFGFEDFALRETILPNLGNFVGLSGRDELDFLRPTS